MHSKYDTPEHEPLVRRPPKSRRGQVLIAIVTLLVFVPFLALFSLQLSSKLRKHHPFPIPKLQLVEDLDVLDTPSSSRDARLILVGDVHGCLPELKKLLKKIGYSSKSDTVVLLGDFISRGPYSEATIDFAVDKNFLCVCGNHEHKILKRYAKHHGLPWTRDFGFVNAEMDDSTDILSSDDSKVARRLLPHHAEYISSCPAILKLGRLAEHNTSAVAVHAGLLWNIEKLEEQDPLAVMFMRNLLPPEYTRFTQKRGGEHWTKLWNGHQKKSHPDARMAVHYGHDARNGLNIQDYTFGIDTGCAAGGRLTAYVFKKRSDGTVHRKLVQVKCKISTEVEKGLSQELDPQDGEKKTPES